MNNIYGTTHGYRDRARGYGRSSEIQKSLRFPSSFSIIRYRGINVLFSRLLTYIIGMRYTDRSALVPLAQYFGTRHREKQTFTSVKVR